MGKCRFFKKGKCTRFGEKDICRFDWGADTCYYFRINYWWQPLRNSFLARKNGHVEPEKKDENHSIENAACG